MSSFRRFFGLLPPRSSWEPPQALPAVKLCPNGNSSELVTKTAEFETRTGLEVGVWFYDEKCWAYKGTLPVLLQFHKKTPQHCSEPYEVSGCPACAAPRLKAQYGARVKRWLVIPP